MLVPVRPDHLVRLKVGGEFTPGRAGGPTAEHLGHVLRVQRVRLKAPVTSIRVGPKGWTIGAAFQASELYEGVVLTTPAHRIDELDLDLPSGDRLKTLGSITHPSVAVVALGSSAGDFTGITMAGPAGCRVLRGSPHVTDRLLVGKATAVDVRRHVLAFFQGNRFLLRHLVGHVIAQSGGATAVRTPLAQSTKVKGAKGRTLGLSRRVAARAKRGRPVHHSLAI